MIEVELPATPKQDSTARTPGGSRLRALREQAGMTQLQVELEAEIGTGYLQRLEYGRVQQPVRATLDRILDALGARFSERREVLELFGYLVDVKLPDSEERAWAAEVARPELDHFPFPAYLLDCGHRLVLWNDLFPRLFGENGDRVVRDQLTGGSFLEAWFDPASPITPLLSDPEETLTALLRAFRHEMRQFHYAAWYTDLLASLHRLERFRSYWELTEQETAHPAAARAIMPIRLRVPGVGDLRFRLSAEQFTRDTRFRIIYYFPSDATTMTVCERWNQETQETSGQEIGPT